MKPEQQRIAIAKACGWTQYKWRCGQHSYSTWVEPGETYKIGDRQIFNVPGYLNDLNAMHEAEKVLFDKLYWAACDYEQCLQKITSSWAWHATAAQRAEAFLRTLNLWTWA